eukprot:1997670-Rhodomonas_salina.2
MGYPVTVHILCTANIRPVRGLGGLGKSTRKTCRVVGGRDLGPMVRDLGPVVRDLGPVMRDLRRVHVAGHGGRAKRQPLRQHYLCNGQRHGQTGCRFSGTADQGCIQGVKGGVEMAFLSTTTDLQVAIDYAGASGSGVLPTVFAIQVGAVRVT